MFKLSICSMWLLDKHMLTIDHMVEFPKPFGHVSTLQTCKLEEWIAKKRPRSSTYRWLRAVYPLETSNGRLSNVG